jgi:hypothetical protein
MHSTEGYVCYVDMGIAEGLTMQITCPFVVVNCMC